MNILRKISKWYFSKGALPYWCVLIMDCTCVYLAGIICYYLEFGGLSLAQQFWQLTLGLLCALIGYIGAFVAFHTYRGIFRFASFVDLINIAYAMMVASFVICTLHQVQVHVGLTKYLIIPHFTTCMFIAVVGTLLMWLIRIVVKNCHDMFVISEHRQGIFIYGTLSGGIALAKSIRNTPQLNYKILGFVTADSDMAGSWLLGTQVYMDSETIPMTMKKKGASILMVSPIQSEHFRTRSTLIDALINENIKIMMMPAAEEWDGKSDLSHTQLHDVDIEDLLPRDKIEVDMVAIGKLLKSKTVLITGAAGSIGSEMARQVAKFSPSALVLVDQAETPMHDMRLYMSRNHADLNVLTVVGSISNKEHMERLFAEHKPDYVFHAAAYKHVPMMEDNPAMAVQNNVYGTRVIADLAVKYSTKKFVMISTDKAVNPTNVMGCSKRICEIYCQSLNFHQNTTQFVTTRFGNVLGSNGSVIPIFKEQIKKGGPVTVTHPDIIRFFMLIPEACRLVLEAGTMGKGGEIFVFDMGNPVRIVDLAKRMISLSGAKGVEIKFTGLRDGEKLYEEVLNDAESTIPTVHPKIMVAKVREVEYEQALKDEEELYQLSFSFDDMNIVRKMKEIVPEYRSQNSKYQSLDK